MKIKTTDSVKFYPEKRKDKDKNLITENVPVYASFSYERKRLKYYTGEHIDLSKWDDEKSKAKQNISQNGRKFNEINKNLNNIASIIIQIYDEYKAKQIPLRPETFRDELKGRMGEKTGVNSGLIALMDKFIETSGDSGEWTESTRKKFRTMKKHLIEAKMDMQVNDVDVSIFSGMQKYFQGKGMVNNTVKKNLKLLKWFLRWLIKHEYVSGKTATRIINYKPKLKDISELQRQKINLIALTRDEIEAIKKVEIPETKKYLERVRDVFLFQCYTALRYSDVHQLRKHNIVEKDGSAFLSITTTKDSEFIEYKMINPAIEIINKYKNSEDLEHDRVLPVISNQRTNEYLKELGRLAELDEKIIVVHYRGNTKEEEAYPKWQLLTTKVGRKTFATTAVEAGISLDELMRIVGHSNFEMLKVYYTVREERLSNAMDKIGGLYG